MEIRTSLVFHFFNIGTRYRKRIKNNPVNIKSAATSMMMMSKPPSEVGGFASNHPLNNRGKSNQHTSESPLTARNNQSPNLIIRIQLGRRVVQFFKQRRAQRVQSLRSVQPDQTDAVSGTGHDDVFVFPCGSSLGGHGSQV